MDGPGSTTTDRDATGSRSTHVLVPSSVIGEALGPARTPPATRSSPPDQVTEPRSTSVRSRSGIDRDAESPAPSTSGMNISTARPRAAASTSRGEECRPTSRQVR